MTQPSPADQLRTAAEKLRGKTSIGAFTATPADPMTIQPGQIYRPAKGGPLRIKVVSAPSAYNLNRWSLNKATVVTLTADGREVRARSIDASQLHATTTTRDGQPRRTGYVLDTSETR